MSNVYTLEAVLTGLAVSLTAAVSPLSALTRRYYRHGCQAPLYKGNLKSVPAALTASTAGGRVYTLVFGWRGAKNSRMATCGKLLSDQYRPNITIDVLHPQA